MTNAAGQKSEVSEADITKAFKNADMDSDGFVTRQEAKRAYKRLSKLFSRPIDSVRSLAYRRKNGFGVEMVESRILEYNTG